MNGYAYPYQRFKAAMRKALRKPGEDLDLLSGESLDKITETYTLVRDSPLVLLWSKQHPDVDANVASIEVDPSAGRAERPGFMTAKEAGCSAQEMRHVAGMLDRQMVQMRRWPLSNAAPQLSEPMEEHFAWRVRWGRMGRKSLECLPYALRWLEDCGIAKAVINVTEVSDPDRHYRARIGPMALHWMLDRLGDDNNRAVCLIPHFKRSRPREAFEFQRGPAWTMDWYRMLERA